MKNTETKTETKAEIRKRILKERAVISPELRRMRSREMAGLLFSCAFYQAADEVFCYVSFRDEAETRFIIEESLCREKRVAVPKVLAKRTLEFYYIESLEQLVPGKYGIPEPEEEDSVPAVPGQNSLIIMPGAAFDRRGNRIGYGGGFYDTYLQRYPFCRRTALCFPEQIVPSVPPDAHDIPAEIIITGKEIIECSQDCQTIR